MQIDGILTKLRRLKLGGGPVMMPRRTVAGSVCLIITFGHTTALDIPHQT